MGHVDSKLNDRILQDKETQKTVNTIINTTIISDKFEIYEFEFQFDFDQLNIEKVHDATFKTFYQKYQEDDLQYIYSQTYNNEPVYIKMTNFVYKITLTCDIAFYYLYKFSSNKIDQFINRLFLFENISDCSKGIIEDKNIKYAYYLNSFNKAMILNIALNMLLFANPNVKDLIVISLIENRFDQICIDILTHYMNDQYLALMAIKVITYLLEYYPLIILKIYNNYKCLYALSTLLKSKNCKVKHDILGLMTVHVKYLEKHRTSIIDLYEYDVMYQSVLCVWYELYLILVYYITKNRENEHLFNEESNIWQHVFRLKETKLFADRTIIARMFAELNILKDLYHKVVEEKKVIEKSNNEIKN